jgi:HEAT repeats
MAHVRIDLPEIDPRPDVIREALAGRVSTLPPSAALALVSDLQMTGTEQHSLLQEAVQDRHLEPHVRVGAVRHYMRVGAESACPTLLKVLESPDERVAAAAASALGQIGTAQHIPALDKAKRGGDLLRQRAAFARTLIIHRFGIADQEAELPPVKAQAAPEVGGLSFTSVRPGRDRCTRALQAIKREFPSCDTAKQVVYELQCGPRLIEVAIDRSCTGSGVKTLKQKPALAGIIAFQSVEYDEFYPRLLVLSRPNGTKVRLTITTLTGNVVYCGDGSVDQSAAEGELYSAERPGVTPIAARIVATAKGLTVSGVSGRVAALARTPSKRNA